MSPEPLDNKKQILSDPVAALSSLDSTVNAEDITQLEELGKQLKPLRQQLAEEETQTKTISRRIGEAKKSGLPTDDLVKSMQKRGHQKKLLLNKIEVIEHQILDFFKPDDNTDNKHNSLPDVTRPDITVDIKNTRVSLLNNEDQSWNDYMANHPSATIHHHAKWRDVFKQTYGLESIYFIAHENNKVVGILPLTHLNSRLFGNLLVSMPYFQRAGAIADHPIIENALMEAARKYAEQNGIQHIEYRDDIPREQLPCQSHKVNMVLSLPESDTILWKGFSSKLRAQIKKPQRISPEVHIGGTQYLDDFYSVYSRNMRDLGSPAHSKALVRNILQKFPNNSWIVVLRHSGQPVSAGLLLGFGNTMEIPLASTIREANALSMNMLFYWEVLKFAIQQGYTAFDFGRSSVGAGTYRFKQQWGAQPRQLYWHYWLGEKGEMPSLNPSNPKYAMVINIWKRLPVWLTRWLGPRLVKNLP